MQFGFALLRGAPSFYCSLRQGKPSESSQLQGLPEAISEWSVFLLSAGCNVSILEEAVTQHLTTVRREVCLGFRFHQHDGEGLMGLWRRSWWQEIVLEALGLLVHQEAQNSSLHHLQPSSPLHRGFILGAPQPSRTAPAGTQGF